MSSNGSVAKSCGYVLTDDGRAGLRSDEVCSCLNKRLEAGFVMCSDCGTVYGKLLDVRGGSARADYKALGR